MKVPYTSFKKIISDNRRKYSEKFLKTLDSGNYINGKECLKFEKVLQNIVNTNYSSGTSNGTCALRMGLEELNFPKKFRNYYSSKFIYCINFIDYKSKSKT